jgi:diphthamide synthase (EF-2-diphthine--ammonia ligase)
MAAAGMTGVFPLWGRDTADLAQTMLDGGAKATVVCVDPNKLDKSYCGRVFDVAFVAKLPAGIDPLGEYGEFHTFAWDGPAFRWPVRVRKGDVVERDGFVFADMVPVESEPAPA